jgi:hypothetical protein
LAALEGWVQEVAEYLDKVLELNPVEQQDLNPLLLECAIEAVKAGEAVTADLLYQKAAAGGYRLLAERLAEITAKGTYGWLFATPTNLPLSGATGDLLFLGFSQRAQEILSEEARNFYLGRFFAAWARQLATTPRQSVRPTLLVLDEAQQLLSQPQAAQALLWLKRNAAPLGLSLWALSPRCDEWLLSTCGQRLLDAATWQVFFNQNGAGLAAAARRLALPQRALKVIRDSLPGAALLRHASGALTEVLPLPGDYVFRLIPTAPKKQLAAPVVEAREAANQKTVQATPSPAEAKPASSPRPHMPEPLPATAKNGDNIEEVAPAAKSADKDTNPVYIFAGAKGA